MNRANVLLGLFGLLSFGCAEDTMVRIQSVDAASATKALATATTSDEVEPEFVVVTLAKLVDAEQQTVLYQRALPFERWADERGDEWWSVPLGVPDGTYSVTELFVSKGPREVVEAMPKDDSSLATDYDACPCVPFEISVENEGWWETEAPATFAINQNTAEEYFGYETFPQITGKFFLFKPKYSVQGFKGPLNESFATIEVCELCSDEDDWTDVCELVAGYETADDYGYFCPYRIPLMPDDKNEFLALPLRYERYRVTAEHRVYEPAHRVYDRSSVGRWGQAHLVALELERNSDPALHLFDQSGERVLYDEYGFATEERVGIGVGVAAYGEFAEGTLKVKNLGRSALELSSFGPKPEDVFRFCVQDDAGSCVEEEADSLSVAPDGEALLRVTFAPGEEVSSSSSDRYARRGTLEFRHNDPWIQDKNDHEPGADPGLTEIQLHAWHNAPGLVLSDSQHELFVYDADGILREPRDTIDFGEASANEAVRSFFLLNRGFFASLEIRNLQVEGEGFAVSVEPPIVDSLPPLAAVEVKVRFSPQIPPIPQKGVLRFKHNDPWIEQKNQSEWTEIELRVAGCGDGDVNTAAGEQCDDGDENSDTLPNACRTNCKNARCGDGVTDAGEACDDGDTDNGDYCSADCQTVTGWCGDGGTPQSNEVCDDGNTDNGDYCSADCQMVTGWCGDGGTPQSNEACDDGNTDNGDYCSADCQTVTGWCGDGGTPQSNEACDDGNTDNGDYCSADCQTVTGWCGDGTKQSNEDCDSGSTNSDHWGQNWHCNADCSGDGPYCGDKTPNNGYEACDDGPLNGTYRRCNSACTGLRFCGDGACDPEEKAGSGCGLCPGDCAPDYGTCSDNDACTIGDVCQPNGGCGGGSARTCNPIGEDYCPWNNVSTCALTVSGTRRTKDQGCDSNVGCVQTGVSESVLTCRRSRGLDISCETRRREAGHCDGRGHCISDFL